MITPDIAARYGAWSASGDTGISSLTLGAVLMGADPKTIEVGYPRDPSDIGRCFRLLEAIPEWKGRIGEMSRISPAWAVLVAHWDEIYALMDQEVGIDWSKRKEAPETYARMRAILSTAGR